MKYNEADVEELVQAALNYVLKPDGTVKHSDFQRLAECVQPFRPKPPRVGWLRFTIDTAENVQAIELTDEVRDALKVAGIEWEETT